MLLLLISLLPLIPILKSQSTLDNELIGDPRVECMDSALKLTFKTQKPFTGRIFVKGMIEENECVTNYNKNKNTTIDYQITNGHCNMRRNRKLGPNDVRGVEQSIVIIVSFHDTFITKIDRAYSCSCLYKEYDKVVTNRFDVSMFPTTEIFDNAQVPTCTYSVHHQGINGPVLSFASVGDESYHVWRCESDMFAMFVHSCFVDSGDAKQKFLLIDENGCSLDTAIVSDLTYNSQTNMAYAQVNVFKFADKVTTYFQCALSTCLISEGACKSKTPPRCKSRRRRTIDEGNKTIWANEMDLTANKIIVLDLEDLATKGSSETAPKLQQLALKHLSEIRSFQHESGHLCLTRDVITFSTCMILTFTCSAILAFLWNFWRKSKL